MDKVVAFVKYVLKNAVLVVGVVEKVLLAATQIIKVLAGIVSLTPTTKDDEFVAKVEKVLEEKIIVWFNKIKELIEKVG